MNASITREIILDLLPVYESGEASPDTRALVEAYLRDHPDLRKVIGGPSLSATGTVRAAPDAEMIALRRARRQLRKKTWFLVMAIFFTFCTFVGSIGPEGLTWSWEISPIVTLVAATLAAVGWFGYLRTSRIAGI